MTQGYFDTGLFRMGLFWFGVILAWGYFGLGLFRFGVILVWGYYGLGLFWWGYFSGVISYVICRYMTSMSMKIVEI